MHKGRLEAFSDGVLAIIITIMVLELHTPDGTTLEALRAVAPKLVLYLLSFVTVAIYWVNHHHMLQGAARVTGAVLWANVHMLFWLSLTPLVTDWVGEHFAPLPVAAYGAVMLMSAVGYYVLSRALLRSHGPETLLGRALARDVKGAATLLIYAAAVGVAFAQPAVAFALYWVVALMWLVPDRRIESLFEADADGRVGH